MSDTPPPLVTLSLLSFLFDAESNDDPGDRSSRSYGLAAADPQSETVAPHDATIVQRVCSGDVATFNTLFLTYHHRLWVFAVELTGSPETADEIVQDVFAGIWIRRARWTVLHSIAESLFGAVRNRAYKIRRHRAVACRAESVMARGEVIPALGAAPADPGATVEEADLAARLDAAIARMPIGRRTALMLRWREQLSYAEIAQVMGIAVKAVSFQISRARDDLRSLIDGPE